MKKLLSMIIALTAFSATAGEIKIYDVNTAALFYVSSVSPEFAINQDLGRAWVNITFSSYNEDPFKQDERVKVSGLSYNKDTKEIILDAEGSQTVCARVKFRRLFGTEIRPTGDCKFVQKYYTVEKDNGYEIEKIQRLNITLKF